MKVMPLETAMFLEIYTQMKSHIEEEQQAPVVVKIPVHLVNADQCFYGVVLSRREWVGGRRLRRTSITPAHWELWALCAKECAVESLFCAFSPRAPSPLGKDLSIGREVRGSRETQVCRNAKHKCAEMSNANVQKCQTQICRNAKYKYEGVQNILGVQKWVVLMSYKQRILLLSIIDINVHENPGCILYLVFCALCLWLRVSIRRPAAMQRLSKGWYYNQCISVLLYHNHCIQGWVLQSLKLTSWWLCSITGPPDVGFLQGKRDNCEEHNITNQPLMRRLSRENFAHNETSLVQCAGRQRG